MSTRQVAEMYCHDPACSRVGEPQVFAYYPDTWNSPGEWIEEPECRACHGSCHPNPLDTVALVEDALEVVGEEPSDWTDKGRAFMATAYTLVMDSRREGY